MVQKGNPNAVKIVLIWILIIAAAGTGVFFVGKTIYEVVYYWTHIDEEYWKSYRENQVKGQIQYMYWRHGIRITNASDLTNYDDILIHWDIYESPETCGADPIYYVY